MRKHLNCNWIAATNWQQFIKKLNTKPDLIGLNFEILTDGDFLGNLTALRVLLESKGLDTPIGIGITPSTTQETVDMLRNLGILGIVPSARHYGNEMASQNWARLLFHQPNWPQDLISQLPREEKITKPLIVNFRPDNTKNYLSSMSLNESIFDDWPCKIMFAHSFRDLGNALRLDPKMIIVQNAMIRQYGTFNEFMLMYDTLIRYADINPKPWLCIGVGKETTLDEIKEFQRSGVQGISPRIDNFGLDEFKRAVLTLLEGNTYWPKHIIQTLPGNKANKKTKDIHLTDRQRQVFDLIANRGLSNKQIAQVLRISESTVKIHVSAVMKTMCVRNRTQLALTAK